MIRQANLSDAKNIATLIISGWQTAYKGLINQNFLNSMSISKMDEGWSKNITSQNKDNHIFVYENNNKILGVIRFGKPDDENSSYNAEIHVLYVEPSLKRHGIGTKLFNFAKDYFIKNNTINMIIWCLKGNIPSINFYKKMGGTIVGTRKSVVNNIELEEVGIAYTLNNIVIVDYNNKYAEQISKIITTNLLEINSKDYGIDFVKKHAEEFTASKVKENFSKRTKTFVALENNIVVGTAGLDKSWYNDDGEYWILSVFVDKEYHKKGIGKMLIHQIENYAKEIDAKKLVIPASITACEFYSKLGYKYKDGLKKLNSDKMYIMEKKL